MTVQLNWFEGKKKKEKEEYVLKLVVLKSFNSLMVLK